jgi:hypothetical protein
VSRIGGQSASIYSARKGRKPISQQIRAIVVDPAAPGRLAIKTAELREPDRDEMTVRVTAISLNSGRPGVRRNGPTPGGGQAGILLASLRPRRPTAADPDRARAWSGSCRPALGPSGSIAARTRSQRCPMRSGMPKLRATGRRGLQVEAQRRRQVASAVAVGPGREMKMRVWRVCAGFTPYLRASVCQVN